MTTVTLRSAERQDLEGLRRILNEWCEHDRWICENLDALAMGGPDGRCRCRLIESDKNLLCACVWTTNGEDEVRILAIGGDESALQDGLLGRLLVEQVLEWAEMGISRATVEVPEALAPTLRKILSVRGFVFEGIASGWSIGREARVVYSKYFLYRTVPRKEVMGFLKEFMISMGYEVRNEEGGFRYRVRDEFTRPFTFSQWHRITRSGPDIVAHPPARVIHRSELENLFYPLRIYSAAEKPLVLAMDLKKAEALIDLPSGDPRQTGLFDGQLKETRRVLRLHNLTYSYPIGIKAIREGLPILFYVNKTGAVGSGRIEEWRLDEPGNLYSQMVDMGHFDPQDVRDHAPNSGSLAGKVLAIRFSYYRPLKRPVPLEEIRSLDHTFNPQRARSVSSAVFQSILEAGNPAD